MTKVSAFWTGPGSGASRRGPEGQTRCQKISCPRGVDKSPQYPPVYPPAFRDACSALIRTHYRGTGLLSAPPSMIALAPASGAGLVGADMPLHSPP